MEHEVHVPVSAERLRAALGDPVRVATPFPAFSRTPVPNPSPGA
jgi:hypothetical protein